MLRFGYRAVTEQYSPSKLLDNAVRAKQAGFDFITASDHFHPWFHTGGHAPFSWIWIASAMERISGIVFGSGVTAPSQRYNPAIIAQAFATLGAIHPGRIFLTLGTGEAMNEVPTGLPWLPFKERAERLEEAVKMIRELWNEDFVSFSGRHFKLNKAKIYTRPGKPIPIYLAASGPTVAKMAGKFADGLYTGGNPNDPSRYTEILFPKLREGAKEAGRDPESLEKTVVLPVSFNEDEDRALDATKVWRAISIPGILSKNISDPRELERASRDVDIKVSAKRWLVTTDLDEIVRKVEELVKIGFTRVEVQSVSPNEEVFIEKYGKIVLSLLRERHGESRSTGAKPL